jgi:hypothetical protein
MAVERDRLSLPENRDDEDEDAGALLQRLRDAFQDNNPADWSRAAETLREVDEEVRRIIDRGDLRALPGACLALGFMISLHDARRGARAIRKRAGGNRGKVDPAVVTADFIERNGSLHRRAKPGVVAAVAAKHKISERRVNQLVKQERKKSEIGT